MACYNRVVQGKGEVVQPITWAAALYYGGLATAGVGLLVGGAVWAYNWYQEAQETERRRQADQRRRLAQREQLRTEALRYLNGCTRAGDYSGNPEQHSCGHYVFHIDRYGRTTRVEGPVQRSTGRTATINPFGKRDGDDNGHFIADTLGGPTVVENFFGQRLDMNRFPGGNVYGNYGQMRQSENWAAGVRDGRIRQSYDASPSGHGADVDVDGPLNMIVEPQYDDSRTDQSFWRPTGIIVTFVDRSRNRFQNPTDYRRFAASRGGGPAHNCWPTIPNP